jgi:fucose 4-O-acetylase-like acetyltransferase
MIRFERYSVILPGLLVITISFYLRATSNNPIQTHFSYTSVMVAVAIAFLLFALSERLKIFEKIGWASYWIYLAHNLVIGLIILLIGKMGA